MRGENVQTFQELFAQLNLERPHLRQEEKCIWWCPEAALSKKKWLHT